MARTPAETTAEPFARVLAGIPTASRKIAVLIAAGAEPTRAFALLGPCLLLAEGGIPALTSKGISLGTAYRWRAELEELTGKRAQPPLATIDAERQEQQEIDDAERQEQQEIDDAERRS